MAAGCPSHFRAAHLRDWQPSPPFLELAIFETSDPQRIVRKLDAFCEQVLGARVVRGLFYQSSIGGVTGVALSDARSAAKSERSREHLTDRESSELSIRIRPAISRSSAARCFRS